MGFVTITNFKIAVQKISKFRKIIVMKRFNLIFFTLCKILPFIVWEYM